MLIPGDLLLPFTFYILPLGIIGIVFIVEAIQLTRELIKEKQNNQGN